MNQEIMRKMGFNSEVKAVNAGRCPICKQMVALDEFKDKLSRKEFEISGLCQNCQDKIFF